MYNTMHVVVLAVIRTGNQACLVYACICTYINAWNIQEDLRTGLHVQVMYQSVSVSVSVAVAVYIIASEFSCDTWR